MKIISAIFIILGIFIVCYPKICEVIAEKDECIKKYQEEISNKEKDDLKLEFEKANLYNRILSGEITGKICERYEDILNLANDGIMSYIEIPKISVKLPIYHGTQSEDMKKGVRSYRKNIISNWRKFNTLCINRTYWSC